MLINQNAQAKHHVKVGLDAEDYYRTKDGKIEIIYSNNCKKRFILYDGMFILMNLFFVIYVRLSI